MKPSELPSPAAPTPSFPADFERAAQRLRGALTELLASVGANPSTPQAIARKFGLNKNLAWKACKIVNTADVYQSVQHLPGASGVEILLKGLQAAGASSAAVKGVREAVADFERMIELHAGDRASLELMIGSMVPERVDSPRLEQSRKLAFQGNSAIFGVKARVRAALSIIAPSAEDAGWLDVAVVSGMLGLQRMRPTVSWPLAQYMAHVEGEDSGPRRIEPIDPASPGGAPLLTGYSSTPLPAIRGVPDQSGTMYELCEGPVGNTAAIDCLFGWTIRPFAPLHGSVPEERGEYFMRMRTPVEIAVYDVLVHRDLPIDFPPELDLYSLMQGKIEFPLLAGQRYMLPRTVSLQDLGSGPPVLATPHVPMQAEVAALACDRLGRRVEDFHGYRFSMSFPPIPTLAVVHFPLPVEGGA